MASRETHFLCSFTSLLYFHLRFNYLPSSHLRMCRLPFTARQALHACREAQIFSFKKKKKVDKPFWLHSMCTRQSSKDVVFQEYQWPCNKICCLLHSSVSLSWDLQLCVRCTKELIFSIKSWAVGIGRNFIKWSSPISFYRWGKWDPEMKRICPKWLRWIVREGRLRYF